MARIVRSTEAGTSTPFREPTFEMPGEGPRGVLSLEEELLAPEDALALAQEEAAAILERAETEAEQLRAEAKSAGYAAGQEAGKQEALEEHRAAANTLGALVGAIRAEHIQTDVDATRYVTEVAIAIVHRLLGDLVEAQPDVMRHVVSQAIAALSRRQSVTVRVHPTLVDVVERQRDTLLRIYKDVGELNILGDDAVEFGGCLLDAEAVTIDATVDAVLARLRSSVLEEVDMLAEAQAEAEAEPEPEPDRPAATLEDSGEEEPPADA